MSSVGIPIKDVSHFYRDKNSGAIVNKNRDEYVKTVAAKKKAQHLQTRISSLERSVNSIENILQNVCKQMEKMNNKDNG